mmetsp:Transcript_15706/g.36012  ORF Transcript_15706/g.36012 Transcript_15706/m.36012 type:complete len:307 (+) Transcript_15706:248-1168(+)
MRRGRTSSAGLARGQRMLSIDLVVAVLLLSLVLQNQQHYAATAFAPPPSASWPPPRSIIVAHTPEGRAGVSLLASSSSSSSSSSSDNQTMTLIEETDNDNTILLTQEEEDELLEENVEFLDDSFSGNSILTDEQLNKLEDAPYSKNGYSLMTGRYSTMLDEPILSRLFQPNRKNQKQEKMQQQQQQHSFPQPPPLATATTTSSSTTTTTTTKLTPSRYRKRFEPILPRPRAHPPQPPPPRRMHSRCTRCYKNGFGRTPTSVSEHSWSRCVLSSVLPSINKTMAHLPPKRPCPTQHGSPCRVLVHDS